LAISQLHGGAMKKQLLTSTALIAAGVFALAPSVFAASHAKPKRPHITVNGYHEQLIGAVINEDEDVAGDVASLDVHGEHEIHFNGIATLDNGISLRAHTELETNPDQGRRAGAATAGSNEGADYIDEVYLIIRGSFGQITIGSEDNAAHAMLIGATGSWATGVGQNLTFDSAEWVSSQAPDFGTVRDSRLTAQDGDTEKVSYFTPRFSGFQIGASYIPGSSAQEDISGAMQDADAAYHDGFALGVNYLGKIGSTGIFTGVGYVQQQAPDTDLIGAVAVDDDVKNFAAALRLDFGPIRVAGGIKRTASDETGGTDRRGRVIDTGVRYTSGASSFSLTYAHGERQSDSTKYEAGMASYAQALGPGVKWHANLIWSDSDNAAGTVNNTGFAISTGIRLSF